MSTTRSFPAEVGMSNTGLSEAYGVGVSGNYAFVTNVDDLHPKLVVFDISNPASPSEVTSTNTDLTDPENITVSGNTAYVLDESNGLSILILPLLPLLPK
jgi:hypothetical protein